MDRDTAVATLADSLRRASDEALEAGCDWYPDGPHRTGTVGGDAVLAFAREYRISYRRAAAVVAVCNMNNTWAGSLTQSRAILDAHRAGHKRPPRAGLPVSTARAWAVLNDAPLTRENIGGRSGDKTWNFYRNLCGDTDGVTCDRWACRAAGLPDSFHQTSRRYEFLADCYRDAAAEVGLTPAQAQAVAWITVRGKVN